MAEVSLFRKFTMNAIKARAAKARAAAAKCKAGAPRKRTHGKRKLEESELVI